MVSYTANLETTKVCRRHRCHHVFVYDILCRKAKSVLHRLHLVLNHCRQSPPPPPLVMQVVPLHVVCEPFPPLGTPAPPPPTPNAVPLIVDIANSPAVRVIDTTIAVSILFIKKGQNCYR